MNQPGGLARIHVEEYRSLKSIDLTNPPMAHDHHFLSRLDRLASVHLDLAMELYRDPEVVRAVIRRGGSDGDRIAIALDHGGVGPYVVVSKEGHFVTCLSRGMSVGDRPVVDRNKLDEVIEQVRTVRQRAQVLSELRPNDDEGTLASRLGTAGEFLSREEMMGLLALRPVYKYALYHWAAKICRIVPERLVAVTKIGAPKPQFAKGIKLLYQLYWAVGHLGVLWGADSHELSDIEGSSELLQFINVCAFITGCRPIVLRGIYAITGNPQATLALCDRQYNEERLPTSILNAIYALVALALRSPKHEREVRSILRTEPALPDPDPRYFAWVRKTALAILERDWPGLIEYEGQSKEHAFRVTQWLPEGAPGRFASASEVPTEVARAFAFRMMSPAFTDQQKVASALSLLPWLVDIRPENFYLPASVRKACYRPWQTERGMALIRTCQKAYEHKVEVKPVVHVPAPNQPCSCGSGKKYKKCCGAPGKGSEVR